MQSEAISDLTRIGRAHACVSVGAESAMPCHGTCGEI